MKRNVLHFIYGFDPGGTEHQFLQLAAGLQQSGRYRVHLACLKRYGNLLPQADALNGAPLPEFPVTSFYNATMWRELRRFGRFLREREIDLVHTHDFYSNVFGMTGAALSRRGVRVTSKRETLGLRTPAQDVVEKQAFRLAHRIVANADAVRQHLQAAGVSARKIVTLYNGLDLDRVRVPHGWARETACHSFGLPPSRRFVTIVANLRAVKDHRTFLQAAQIVRAEISDAAFVLAGEGELRPALTAYAAELGLAEDVFLLGNCQRLNDLLHLSAVCALSSRAEGFSNSLLEYSAAGRPVVATDVGGAREAVREGVTGYLVTAGDAAAMAARLIELLRDPATAQKMGAYGRQFVTENFSQAAQVARTEELYETLLRAHAENRKPQNFTPQHS